MTFHGQISLVLSMGDIISYKLLKNPSTDKDVGLDQIQSIVLNELLQQVKKKN